MEVMLVGSGPNRFTRREFIRRSAISGAALGIGGNLLAACSGSSSPNTSGQKSPPALNRDPETLIVATWERRRDGYDSHRGDPPVVDGYDAYDPIKKWARLTNTGAGPVRAVESAKGGAR